MNLYIYIFLCVRLDDGIEVFSLFVVLSTYRDRKRGKEREGGESVDMFLVTETIILSRYENGCGFSGKRPGQGSS